MDWETLFCDVDDSCRTAEPLFRQRMLIEHTRHRSPTNFLVNLVHTQANSEGFVWVGA